ncbi:DMT family transporter [Microbacterium suwonense]|uniref:QacE family quaternary ammonium compound efflux SMR transporter n=1 Tax=Microbacterium suwonense TaxID=683047 RepID=A0ABM8FUD5_9MICO|nr:SMR family transporter [Microbacterium suwonense]BDZ39300.1 QacE family quaternary ammonium compound efflux SMR transporter [Microbacterium suwonense]
MRRGRVLLSGAIVAEVCATLSLRAANDSAPWLAVAAVGYVAAFFFLALTLRAGMKIGVAYGIWSACGIVLTAVAAAVIFGELLTWSDALGIGLIVGGVALVEFGSRGESTSGAQ